MNLEELREKTIEELKLDKEITEQSISVLESELLLIKTAIEEKIQGYKFGDIVKSLKTDQVMKITSCPDGYFFKGVTKNKNGSWSKKEQSIYSYDKWVKV